MRMKEARTSARLSIGYKLVIVQLAIGTDGS
jgi:hypothetical protein